MDAMGRFRTAFLDKKRPLFLKSGLAAGKPRGLPAALRMSLIRLP